MSGQEDTATLFAARGFGNRIGFGDRPAILVVDMINGFTDPSLPLGSSLGREIDATREVLDAARSASTSIFFTAVAYRDKELGDRELEYLIGPPRILVTDLDGDSRSSW